MSTIKISIAEMSEKNGWINVRTIDDKELSILVKDGKNPKTKAIMEKASAGQEVEIPAKIVEKDGKSYVWDVEDKKSGFGNKSFTPADKSFDAAKIAAQAAANFHSLDKERNLEKVKESAEGLHAWIMSKITPKA